MGGDEPDYQPPQGPTKIPTWDTDLWAYEDANPMVYGTGWTSWDKGETWARDNNTHFRDQYGNSWYVMEGEDSYDKSKWRRDTLAGYHMSNREHDAWNMQKEAAQRAEEESARAKSQWDAMFAFQKEQASLAQQARQKQLDLLDEERLANEASMSAQARKEAIFKQRALRFATGRRRGRSSTIKTGSLGLSDDMLQGKSKTLGGVA